MADKQQEHENVNHLKAQGKPKLTWPEKSGEVGQTRTNGIRDLFGIVVDVTERIHFVRTER
jgi:hypothetical protein